jgi:HK97 family phage major capsid protein
MTVSERIAELLKQRAAKVKALEELSEKSEKENRAMNDEENAASDEVEKAIEDLDATIERLKKQEAIIARGSAPAAAPRITIAAAPKGIRFARMCLAIAASRGNFMQAQEIAKMHWPDDTEMNSILRAQSMGITRAAVDVGSTTNPAWAGALVNAEILSNEIIELVMADAIIGKLTQVRRVPFNVRIPREIAAIAAVKWVGQGLSKPAGRGAYDLVTVPWSKVSIIVAITEELARFSNPAAEQLMRDSLVRSVSGFLDDQFVDSTMAPVANVSPGGITNGLPGGQTFVSAGSSVEAIQQDLATAVGILNAVSAPRVPTWIMNPQTAIAVAAKINAFGQPAFQTMTLNPPTLFGYPVIVSAYLPSTQIILLDQQGVLLAMDNTVTVDVSREASVQMDDTPTTPPAPLVSFWQQNLIGLKAEQFAYWLRARDTDVVLITGVDYVTPTPI